MTVPGPVSVWDTKRLICDMICPTWGRFFVLFSMACAAGTLAGPSSVAGQCVDPPVSGTSGTGATSCELRGPPAVLGSVQVQAYVDIGEGGVPLSLGIRLPGRGFASLPTEAADGYRCLDLDQNDRIDVEGECVGGHERVLFLPDPWSETIDSPFKWALFNWNPAGHGPPGIWDVPHFDFHFFIQSLADRSRIRIGPCAMLVNCDDLLLGTQPVGEGFLPDGYEDRGVVEFGMGNHLIDPSTFGSASEPPTHTLIYGSWAGRVSFLEPMITLEYLEQLRSGQALSGCHPVPRPQRVIEAGHYPSRYCIRHDPDSDVFTIAIEDFEWRMAGSGPQ